jgi:hypothetical protein
MITKAPNLDIGPARLAEVIATMRTALSRAPKWRYCEKYVDRGHRADPFYLLDITAIEQHPGNSELDEPLFRTHIPGLRIKQFTRANDSSGQYFQVIETTALGERLDRFLAMYRANELQPPGRIGQREHDVFQMRRFIYRLCMPGTEIVAIGPAAFAGRGAVRGRVSVGGAPVAGLAIELRLGEGPPLRRTSDGDGRFLFSRVPAGRHSLFIEGYELTLTPSSEPFGRVRGHVTVEGKTLADLRVELETPDGERFETTTAGDGSFDFGLMPAGPQIVRVHDFSVKQDGSHG